MLPKVAEDKESDTQEEEGDQATSEVDIPHNEESPGVLRCLQKGRKGTQLHLYIDKDEITFVHWKRQDDNCILKGTRLHFYTEMTEITFVHWKRQNDICILKGTRLHLYTERTEITFVNWKDRDTFVHWNWRNYICTLKGTRLK